MTQTTDRLAEVLDCDRDSAADWLHDTGLVTWEGAGRIRRGEDSHSLVELLTRHRQAATQSLAVQRIEELPMVAFSDRLPERDEMMGEQTILVHTRAATWSIEFFEAGWEFPNRWLYGEDAHWLDITSMWPGVTAQVTEFRHQNADDLDKAQQQLKTVLDREAETHRRHDAKVDALEGRIAELEAENVVLRAVMDAADRYNGIHSQSTPFAGRMQGILKLAIMRAYRVTGLTRDDLTAATAALNQPKESGDD